MKTFYNVVRQDIIEEMLRESGAAVVRPAAVDAAINGIFTAMRTHFSNFPRATFTKLHDEDGNLVFTDVVVAVAGSATTAQGEPIVFTNAGFNVIIREV